MNWVKVCCWRCWFFFDDMRCSLGFGVLVVESEMMVETQVRGKADRKQSWETTQLIVVVQSVRKGRKLLSPTAMEFDSA